MLAEVLLPFFFYGRNDSTAEGVSLSLKLGPISGQIHLKEDEEEKKKRVEPFGVHTYVPLSPPSPASASFKFPLGCCWLLLYCSCWALYLIRYNLVVVYIYIARARRRRRVCVVVHIRKTQLGFFFSFFPFFGFFLTCI